MTLKLSRKQAKKVRKLGKRSKKALKLTVIAGAAKRTAGRRPSLRGGAAASVVEDHLPVEQHVVAGAAEQDVLARAAVEDVVALFAAQDVVARASKGDVVAAAREQDIGAVGAEQDVVAVAAQEEVVARSAVGQEADGGRRQPGGVDGVAAGEAVDLEPVVGGRGARQGDLRREPRDRAVADHDVVVAVGGVHDHRVGVAARHREVEQGRVHGGQRGAGEVVDGKAVGAPEREQVDGLHPAGVQRDRSPARDAHPDPGGADGELLGGRAAAGRHPVRARPAFDDVAAVGRVGSEAVVAGAEERDVVAAAAVGEVVPVAADQRVVPGAAPQGVGAGAPVGDQLQRRPEAAGLDRVVAGQAVHGQLLGAGGLHERR